MVNRFWKKVREGSIIIAVFLAYAGSCSGIVYSLKPKGEKILIKYPDERLEYLRARKRKDEKVTVEFKWKSYKDNEGDGILDYYDDGCSGPYFFGNETVKSLIARVKGTYTEREKKLARENQDIYLKFYTAGRKILPEGGFKITQYGMDEVPNKEHIRSRIDYHRKNLEDHLIILKELEGDLENAVDLTVN
jgi:hypothetical protein